MAVVDVRGISRNFDPKGDFRGIDVGGVDIGYQVSCNSNSFEWFKNEV